MSTVATMSDAELERRIRIAQARMEKAEDEDVRRVAWYEMKALINQRSKAQVERMERAMGLRS